MSFSHSPRIVTDGLVLCLDAANPQSYPGSGTSWTDLSGNGNTGTLINGPTFSTGNSGSLVFDGVDDYVDLGTKEIITTDFTYNTWFQITDNDKEHYLLSFGYNASPSAVIFRQAFSEGARRIRIVYLNSSGAGVATDFDNSSEITIGNRYNISITRSVNTNTLYINGKQSGSTFENGTAINTTRYILGYAIPRNKPSSFFKGNLYSANLYNRALSASEVLQNYEAVKSRFGL